MIISWQLISLTCHAHFHIKRSKCGCRRPCNDVECLLLHRNIIRSYGTTQLDTTLLQELSRPSSRIPSHSLHSADKHSNSRGDLAELRTSSTGAPATATAQELPALGGPAAMPPAAPAPCSGPAGAPAAATNGEAALEQQRNSNAGPTEGAAAASREAQPCEGLSAAAAGTPTPSSGEPPAQPGQSQEPPVAATPAGATAGAPAKALAIVQEYMEGGSLYQLLQLQEQLGDSAGLLYTRQEALKWLLEAAQALQYLHQQRPMVIHRCGYSPPGSILLLACGYHNAKSGLRCCDLQIVAFSELQCADEVSNLCQHWQLNCSGFCKCWYFYG